MIDPITSGLAVQAAGSAAAAALHVPVPGANAVCNPDVMSHVVCDFSLRDFASIENA